MSVIPPIDPRDLDLVNTSLQLPKWMNKRLGEIAEVEHYSRNQIAIHLLKWALQAYDAEKAGTDGERKPKK